MKFFKIDAADFQSTQEIFSTNYATTTEKFDFGNKLQIDLSKGFGEIYFLEFNDGISMILFDCNLHEALHLEVDTKTFNPLYLMYPLREGIHLSSISGLMNTYQPVIVGSGKQENIKIKFPGNQMAKLIIIKIDRQLYAHNKRKLLNHRQVLNTIFCNCDSLTTSVHTCGPNLQLADMFQKLSQNTLKESVGIYLLEAEVNLIIGHILSQYVKEANMEEEEWALTKRELEIVRQLAKDISKNPGHSYTIQELTNRTGLNPYKLQKGFKQIYKRTAIDFIKDKRLTQAAELLVTNDYNVTQVVERIGLTSKSYFTKIFKEKYNCCPKDYQNQVKRHINTIHSAG